MHSKVFTGTPAKTGLQNANIRDGIEWTLMKHTSSTSFSTFEL